MKSPHLTCFRNWRRPLWSCRRFPNLRYRRFPNRQAVQKSGASGVSQAFLSAVSRAFLPAGCRDDSGVRFLGGAWPTGKSAERQTRMSAVRVWSRTRLAVRWPNGPQVGPAARDAIRQTGPAKREAVRGKSPSPTAATERPARAGSPPSFFLYQHPEGVPAFNLLAF